MRPGGSGVRSGHFKKEWGNELAVAAVITIKVTAANECLLPGSVLIKHFV